MTLIRSFAPAPLHRFGLVLLASLAALLLLVQQASAQVFPSRADGPITDDAAMLEPEVLARLSERLAAFNERSGAQVEVVTLISMALYTGGEDIEPYAAALAREFGLTEAPEGRYALLLIFRDDRELRLETGPGLGAEASATATAIINDRIAPAFQAGDFSGGIDAGVEGILTRLMGEAPTAAAPGQGSGEGSEGPSGGALAVLLALLGIPAAGVVWFKRRKAAKLAATPCPSCGKTGLTQSRVTLIPATQTSEGQGETRTTCPHCSHSSAVPYRIPRKSAPRKATAGAKSGGASGKW